MSHTTCLQGSRRQSTKTPTRRRLSPNPSLSLALSLSLSILITLFFLTPTLAQSPSPVQEMAFMRGGNYLYVQGGKYVANEAQVSVSAQLAALDLSKPWSTASPSWKLLAAGPAYNLYNGVATADNQTLITFFNKEQLYVNIYNVVSNSWQYTGVATSGELLQAIRTVLDPKTGLVYIAGANNMNMYDPRQRTLSYTPIPPNILMARFFAGAVYNSARRSIMYMGGVTGSIQYEGSTYITEYLLDSQAWGTYPTIGDLPTPRSDHCMAASENGNTVVMFGGRTPGPGNFTGTFYILDVPSKTWVQGPSSGTRLYSACIIVGDQFLAWGGFDGKSTISGPPIIYNFAQKKWVENYTPPAYFANMPSTAASPIPGVPPIANTSVTPNNGNSGSPSPSSSSSNLGAILGGTLGSLCVAAMAGVVYLYMKRRADKTMYEAQAQQRIIQQAERTNDITGNGSGSGGNGGDGANGQYMKSGDMNTLPPYIATATARNPQVTTEGTSGRSPQDAGAMGLHFEPHNRHDPQLLPIPSTTTPMGEQLFKSPMFIPTTSGYDPTNCSTTAPPTMMGYTTIPVQTTAGLAYMSVPVQAGCPGTVAAAGYGYAPIPVPVQNSTSGLVYTTAPLLPNSAGYPPPVVSAGTPPMGYAFSPAQSDQNSSGDSPGSVHRPTVPGYSVPITPVTGDYHPPPPHPPSSGAPLPSTF
ncbi:hypothetical protein BGX29_004591 [Mortierella sp. GBA35]|nr:hypothetical protein BGX29_004591 [Mortierella sp. GBA35]